MDVTFARLARRQVSETLAAYSVAVNVPRPRGGWISSIREGLDMTIRQLASRLNISPSNVVRLEQRERDDAITLGALRRAANALECDLIYAVVPRSNPGTGSSDVALDLLIAARAREVARSELLHVAHTMALEGQSVSAAELETQIAERAAELARTPRRLWD